MKITMLKVQGFRSLADIEWNPGDLNLLIGPNASGKSNILRVLDMFSQSAEGRLGDYVQREGGCSRLSGMGARTASRSKSRHPRSMDSETPFATV